MVKAIHDLAHVLGLRLVAEGIEDEATVRVLANLDRVIGQGCYYARPMRSPELLEWLRDRADYPVNRGPAAKLAGDLAAFDAA
jgi:EAL domain-containing protein (putative c-di-GMP-specific phosphodiesterase class I)